MSAALQWFLVPAVLLAGLLSQQLCRRLHIPPIPWRHLWVALIAKATAQTTEALDIPRLPGLDINVVVSIVVAVAISRSIIWLVLELLPKLRLLPSSPKILRDLLFIMGSGLLVALTLQEQSSIDLVGLVTTSAVLTAVLGLAAQDPLKDLVGGLSLQLERVIREGDWIEIEGQIGRVASISWRDTELNCFYGSRLTLPHASTNSKSIRNFTSNGAFATQIEIGLDYSMPPHIAKAMMQQISKHHPLVLNDPACVVRIKSFAESAVNYEWINWIDDYGQIRIVRGDLQEQLWYALQREGFSFPFSVRDVRLTKATPEQRTSAQKSKAQLEDSTVELLQNNHLFCILSDKQLARLVQTSSIRSYGPGEIIAVEHETGDSLFMLIKGEVSIVKSSSEQKITEIATLQSGDICGEMTVFTDAPRSATIRSQSQSDILEIHRQAIAELIEAEPVLLDRFSQLISERQSRLEDFELQNQTTPASRRDAVTVMKELFRQFLT